ncbi:hypothetical protein VTK56DRAFT_4800 [Thermocarpiscus australiensis]
MAATIGPDMMVDPPSPDSLDHGAAIRLPGAPAAMTEMPPQHPRPANPQGSLRSNAPPPNPPFVFPPRPSSSSAPSSLSRATGRRPRSAIGPNEPVSMASVENDNNTPISRSPALPAFSFNPGASLPSAPGFERKFLSPTQSPSAPGSPQLVPARPVGLGHRRGGSEFVGGSIRDGEAITVINTSPTKSDGGMTSPLLQPTKPRRGHAHRRSAAISSHDLSSIICSPSGHDVRGSSAPASPAVADRPVGQLFPGIDKPIASEKASSLPVSEPHSDGPRGTSSPAVQLEQASKPAARNRVGFSDTLEYIPRPLSLVSTDTSSTVTARPGHSGSGSISSVISVSNADREANASGSFLTPKPNDSRPSTAGAVMERPQDPQEQEQALGSPRRRGSIPFLDSLAPTIPLNPATPSPTRSSKKWSFFGLDPFVTGSPTRPHPDTPRSAVLHPHAMGSSCTEGTSDVCPDGSGESPGAPKPPSKKRTKKQKKVKTWAGSILSRKGKHRHGKQKRRAPTPPPPRQSGMVHDMVDDAMHMCPEPGPAVPTFTVTESPGTGGWQNWTSPGSTSVPEEDAPYPMIDLDAALGPFNTPLPRNPEWEAAQRAGGHVKKQLHSAAGMSRFSGPGMHYHHRRAESAPELVPFEGGRFGFRRFGSSSTMADVFEEDEEEEENSASNSAGDSTDPSTPTAEVPAAENSKAATQSEEKNLLTEGPQDAVKVDSPVASPADAGQSKTFGAENSSSSGRSVSEQPINFGQDKTALPEPAFQASPGDDNFGSSTPSPCHVFRPKELAPVEVSPLNLPAPAQVPISPYSMTQSSAFPSPRSAMSYDAHRISTAPSSVTEDFQSLLMGEPGPEVRISVDDIPSLTSSNSTMTRDSLFFAQHPQARQPPLSGQPRPASFTSTAFGRRRSSLASLSRLINSSHGERSKLSIEVSMDSEPEKKEKMSKAKRLSRMVKFWKAKDDASV